MPDPSVEIRNASVSYGSGSLRTQALRGVSLEFHGGELALIMGPSGSGKTTLLSVAGCLMKPDAGSVFVHGRDVSHISEEQRTDVRRKHIGFIFQAFRLFHALTAVENVMVAADIASNRSPATAKTAMQLLDNLGLSDRLHLKPDALSGGEKQRVAIARALLPSPTIVLADEPTASLDSVSGRQICTILRRLAADDRRAVVVVSHDPRWNEFADRTIVLEDGRVTEKGTP